MVPKLLKAASLLCWCAFFFRNLQLYRSYYF